MSATTYSFRDLVGSFSHPLAGEMLLSGKLGVGTITVSMSTERTAHDTAADGGIMITYVSGNSGAVTLEMQQTSIWHTFLLGWYNDIVTAAEGSDVSNWASAVMVLQSLLDGYTHVVTGISPAKNPDKPYAAQGQRVSWHLLAADIQST